MKHGKKAAPGLGILQGLKAVLFGCILSAGLIFIYALMLKWGWFRVESIDAMNTVIKALSASLCGGVISGARLQKGWLVAGGCGAGYLLASFGLFALLNGSFQLSFHTLSDVLMAFACAACTCIFCAILREQRMGKEKGKTA